MTDAPSDAPSADEFSQDGGPRDIGQISLGQAPFNPNGQAASNYSFEPITDPALDEHYAGLAQQHDPDAAPGLLGTFQRLPSDGVSDRWRYTPPGIPGAPLTDGEGNPCASWIVSRPVPISGNVADHSFVVVADSPGAPPKARFSYGPSDGGAPDSKLVSLTGVHGNDTNDADVAAWRNWNNPLSGVHLQQIPASDASVLAAGRGVDQQVGTRNHPGSIPYAAIPGWAPSGYANSNTAAAAVANGAIWRDPGSAGQGMMQPYPGTWSPGWGRFTPGTGWPF